MFFPLPSPLPFFFGSFLAHLPFVFPLSSVFRPKCIYIYVYEMLYTIYLKCFAIIDSFVVPACLQRVRCGTVGLFRALFGEGSGQLRRTAEESRGCCSFHGP